MRRVGAALAAPVLFAAVVAAPLSNATEPAAGVQPSLDVGTVQQSIVPASYRETPLDLDIPIAEEGGAGGEASASTALYSLAEFMSKGVVNWGGYRFTYYSQQVLPGGGLAIPGRHVNEGGYVSDADGYIVLAGSAPKGTVFETPFGYPGKIYDRGTYGNHLDVYIR